jgi:transglutaminase-like putative cysteine protease
MRIDPISQYLPSILVVEPSSLAPPENPFIAPNPGEDGSSSVANLLQDIQKIKRFYFQLKTGRSYDENGNTSADTRYEMYLQFPNREMKRLTREIVDPADANDAKAYEILMWVQENIQYISDSEIYGSPEYWALPTMTLQQGRGDCEDGAFLIHSLMLNAGIPYERIRTYGGAVFAGPGAPAGGHAWTAYMRETDDEWVTLDWCYYAEDVSVAERVPLREDLKYFDDWFYVDALSTVDATYTNNLRGSFLNVAV